MIGGPRLFEGYVGETVRMRCSEGGTEGARRNQLYKWQRKFRTRVTGAIPGSGERKERTIEPGKEDVCRIGQQQRS